MSEKDTQIVIEINSVLKKIFTSPKFIYLREYVDIITETTEFSLALVNLEKEIYISVKDSKITKNEIRKISVKMFHVLKLLNDKNFKFKKIDNDKSRLLKELLKENMEELLTSLVAKALDKMKDKHPDTFFTNMDEEDIELIVGTIVDTAEWSIEIAKEKWSKFCSCC